MKFPIGIQSFELIRKDGFVYVDKTDIIHRLAQGHVYFLPPSFARLSTDKERKKMNKE